MGLSKKERKMVDEMMEASNGDDGKEPQKDSKESFSDSLIEARGAIYVLLERLAEVVEHFIDNVPMSIKTESSLELIRYELEEIKSNHFSEFTPEDEEDA